MEASMQKQIEDAETGEMSPISTSRALQAKEAATDNMNHKEELKKFPKAAAVHCELLCSLQAEKSN